MVGACEIINLYELRFARRRRAVAVGATQGDRVFSEVKRLCYAGLDEATLLCEVADRLRRAMPFEGYCAHTVDPLSGLVAKAISEEMGGEKEARLFFEHLYFADDFNEYNSMAKSRRPVALLSEATDGRLERSQRYRELMEPLGYGHELRGVFTAGKNSGAPSTCGAKRVAPTSSPVRSGSSGESPRTLVLASKQQCSARRPLRRRVATAPPACWSSTTKRRVSHYTAAAERLA
jgi:hypothetical protein